MKHIATIYISTAVMTSERTSSNKPKKDESVHKRMGDKVDGGSRRERERSRDRELLRRLRSRNYRRFSPRASSRKNKPVNELDLISLKTQEKEKSRRDEGVAPMRSESGRITGSSRGLSRRLGFTRSSYNGYGNRQGQLVHRGYMPRDRKGLRDATDSRFHQGGSRRAEAFDEEIIIAKAKEKSDKPVMNLFDPCKVPTGRSYFSHDDRTNPPARSRNMMRKGVRRTNYAPVGWRNVAQANSTDRAADDDQRYFNQSRNDHTQERFTTSAADGVWKHDLFEEVET